MKKIAVFVSGRGSNLQALIDKESTYNYQVSLILVSKAEALAIEIAKKHDIPFVVLNKTTFIETHEILKTLNSHDIDCLCLAGFLWMIPAYLIQAYPDKILNIHPSLLPKFGGKGMYGMKVHQAVIDKQEKNSGITIHLVNEEYDKGKVLFQTEIQVLKNDTAASLASKILALEHKYFPEVLHRLCNGEK